MTEAGAEGNEQSLVGGIRRLGFFGSSDFLSSEFHGTSDPVAGAEPEPLPIPESLAAGWEGPPTFGGYELLEQIGRGGMGVVYRARDPKAGRELALKIVLRQAGEASRLQRFNREGQLTAALEHRGIVRVHSAGDVDGVPFLAYELVEEAKTLSEAFEGASRERRLGWVEEAGRALGYAHQKGVVHRDVKPENILVGRDGRARVADFGLAVATDVDRITKSGDFMGTPLFMSPEQFTGGSKDAGPESDVWALGVILYLALTDEIPFDAPNLYLLSERITEADFVRPRRLDKTIPRALESVCLRALHPKAGARYADGEAFADDLRRAVDGEPLAEGGESPLRRVLRRRGPAVLVGVALGLVLGTALVVSNLPGAEPAQPQPEEVAPTERGFELAFPADGQVHTSQDLDLSGTAPVEAARVWLVLNDAPALELGVDPEGAFRASVQLQPGANSLRLRAEDADGRGAGTLSRSLTCAVGPEWYYQRAPEARPPYPLPPGLEFGAAGEYVNSKDRSALVWIPAGTFRMGTDVGHEDERPAHRVQFTRGFFLGKYELTWGQFQRFWQETRGERYVPRTIKKRGNPALVVTDDHPVHGVRFPVAFEYVRWAGLRLPYEAEWEYACRGPSSLPFPWGEDPIGPTRANARPADDRANDPFLYTSPVGSFPEGRSPWGCFDLIGNVREWTLIQRPGYPSQGGIVVDPKPPGPPQPPFPAQRGGSYLDVAKRITSTARVGIAIVHKEVEIDVGIRVARSPD